MGLFTTYLIYKSGKNSARRSDRRRAAIADKFASAEVCDTCGFRRDEHFDNPNEDCPIQ